MIHYAVCYLRCNDRIGCVMTFADEAHANRILITGDHGRLGYVGCDDFQEAITRAGMMQRNEPHAWGVIDHNIVRKGE